jgi:hypothetical protein
MLNISHRFLRRAAALVLTLVIGFAPALPAAASVPADDTAHGSASVASAEAHALHADHAKATKAAEQSDNNPPSSSCYQHDQCSGKCFSATLMLPISSVRPRTVQSPVVPRLHDRLVAAAHYRPPSA